MPAIFDFSHFPQIDTPRLILHQWQLEDADAMIQLFSSPEVLRFLNMEPIETQAEACEFIDWLNSTFTNQTGLQWAIALRDTRQVIGHCGSYNWERNSRHIDIGYHIMPDYWGQGYATETCDAMLRWHFEYLNLHRIQADCTEGNVASEQVLHKCGFTLEGIWRESSWEHGHFVNIKQFGILRHEYRFVEP